MPSQGHTGVIFNCFSLFFGFLDAKPCKIIWKSFNFSRSKTCKKLKFEGKGQIRVQESYPNPLKIYQYQKDEVIRCWSKYHQVEVTGYSYGLGIPMGPGAKTRHRNYGVFPQPQWVFYGSLGLYAPRSYGVFLTWQAGRRAGRQATADDRVLQADFFIAFDKILHKVRFLC